jgi:hypothetical protein
MTNTDDAPPGDPILPPRVVARACRLFECLRDAGLERDRAGNRDFRYSHFAALHLIALFQPTLRSLRGLQQASQLRRIQKLLGTSPVSLGSLSESPAVFDADLMIPIVQQVLAGWSAANPGPGPRRTLGSIPDDLARRLVVADGSLLRVLPQIAAAGNKQARWRMHLRFRPLPGRFDPPTMAADPAADERDVLRGQLEPRCVYVADRGYERYTLFNAIVASKSDYVIRVQDRPFAVVEERPLSDEDRAARVVSDQIIALGVGGRPAKGVTLTHRVRRVVIAARGPGRRRTDQPETGTILLVTSLTDAPAAVIAAIYESRWSIELFFRFLKQVLGLKRLMSSHPNAIAIQTYVAVIACVLLAEAIGGRVTAADYRLFELYLQGWVEDDELQAHLNRRRAKEAPS